MPGEGQDFRCSLTTKNVVSSPLPLTGTLPLFSNTNPSLERIFAVASVTCQKRTPELRSKTFSRHTTLTVDCSKFHNYLLKVTEGTATYVCVVMETAISQYDVAKL